MSKNIPPGQRPSPSEEPGRDETVPALTPQDKPEPARKPGGANPPPKNSNESTGKDDVAENI